MFDDPLHPLVLRLSSHSDLKDPDAAALRGLAATLQSYDAQALIEREASTLGHIPIVTAGFVARYKVTGSKRQVIGYAIAGDVLGFGSLILDRPLAHSRTLAKSELLWIDRKELKKVLVEHPSLALAFWRQSLIDANVVGEWLVNIGRRRARDRICFLLLELHERLSQAGYPMPFQFPLSQVDIADSLGLSLVHTNKSLQALRSEGLIRISTRAFEILDHARLVDVTKFDPAYLGLTKETSKTSSVTNV